MDRSADLLLRPSPRMGQIDGRLACTAAALSPSETTTCTWVSSAHRAPRSVERAAPSAGELRVRFLAAGGGARCESDPATAPAPDRARCRSQRATAPGAVGCCGWCDPAVAGRPTPPRAAMGWRDAGPLARRVKNRTDGGRPRPRRDRCHHRPGMPRAMAQAMLGRGRLSMELAQGRSS